MMIRSNPPGALVYVDNREIGVTPISTSFTYYGIRKIQLVKPGYETLTVMQPVRAPWYEITPLDFVSENAVPGEIRDQRDFCYQLRPQRVVPPEELLTRAEELRRGVHPVVPAGATMPAPATTTAPAPAGPALAPAAPAWTPAGPPAWVPPGSSAPAPAPSDVGGQPVYPLPPR